MAGLGTRSLYVAEPPVVFLYQGQCPSLGVLMGDDVGSSSSGARTGSRTCPAIATCDREAPTLLEKHAPVTGGGFGKMQESGGGDVSSDSGFVGLIRHNRRLVATLQPAKH